jgi:hypothetical protein
MDMTGLQVTSNMQMMKIVILLFFLCSLAGCNSKKSGNPFSERLEAGSINGSFSLDDYVVWGASVVRHDDGKYYMFVSVYPGNSLGSWVTHSQVALATADKPEGHYKFEKYVLPYRGKEYWDGMMTHNPTIQKHGDTYYLFYTGVTYDFDRPERRVNNRDPEFWEAWHNKRIGVATAKHPAGPWTRYDKPIIEPREGQWDLVQTSNPAPVIHKDGSVTLIYKSSNLFFPERFEIQEKDDLPRFILGVARADHVFGEYRRLGDNDGLINIDGSLLSLEDPYVWHDGKLFHMIVKNFTQLRNAEGMGAIYIWSRDAVNWYSPEDNAGVYSRDVTWAEGFKTSQVRLERPQLLFEDGRPAYLFLATNFREEDMQYSRNKGNIYNVVFKVVK